MAYCQDCGQSIPDGAAFCTSCGAAIHRPSTTAPAQASPPAPAAPAAVAPGHVPNYLVPAILLMLFCCLPGGIVALIYGSSVNGKLAQGDRAGAIAASNSAKMWCWISFAVGAGFAVIWFVAWLVPLLMAGMSSPY